MSEPDAKYLRQQEADARHAAAHAQTRSMQILHLKTAERYGAMALDAEQNVVIHMTVKSRL